MTKLVVLGLLKRKPLHGYEIKRIIQEEMGDWTNIAFGSIYFALAQLTKEGYIKQSEPDKKDSRPAKIVYKITAKGEKEFLALLTQVWKKYERQYFTIDIALFFSEFTPIALVKKFLKKKMLISRMALRHIKKHQQEEFSRKDLPAIAEAIFTHSFYHIKAEYLWLKDVAQRIEKAD